MLYCTFFQRHIVFFSFNFCFIHRGTARILGFNQHLYQFPVVKKNCTFYLAVMRCAWKKVMNSRSMHPLLQTGALLLTISYENVGLDR